MNIIWAPAMLALGGLVLMVLVNGFMRWGLRRGMAPFPSIMGGTLATLALASIAFVVWRQATGQNLFDIWQKNFKQNLDMALAIYNQLEINPAELQRVAKILRMLMVDALVGWLVVLAMGFSLFCYSLQRRWLPDAPGSQIPFPPFIVWAVPDKWIWILLGVMVLFLVGTRFSGWTYWIGLNFIIVLGNMYFTIGLAIVFFFLSQRPWPTSLKVITVLALGLLPGIIFFLFLLGVLDTWWDWRRLKQIPDKSNI